MSSSLLCSTSSNTDHEIADHAHCFAVETVAIEEPFDDDERLWYPNLAGQMDDASDEEVRPQFSNPSLATTNER